MVFLQLSPDFYLASMYVISKRTEQKNNKSCIVVEDTEFRQ